MYLSPLVEGWGPAVEYCPLHLGMRRHEGSSPNPHQRSQRSSAVQSEGIAPTPDMSAEGKGRGEGEKPLLERDYSTAATEGRRTWSRGIPGQHSSTPPSREMPTHWETWRFGTCLRLLRDSLGIPTYGSRYYTRSEDTTTRKHPLHFH